jgi:hypothetical protein
VTDSGTIFDGEAWDYLGVVAGALSLHFAISFLLGGEDGFPGTILALILAMGSVALMVSVFLYAIEFDPGDGVAFGFIFFGIVFIGLSTLLI